jgi:hypothetical protein
MAHRATPAYRNAAQHLGRYQHALDFHAHSLRRSSGHSGPVDSKLYHYPSLPGSCAEFAAPQDSTDSGYARVLPKLIAVEKSPSHSQSKPKVFHSDRVRVGLITTAIRRSVTSGLSVTRERSRFCGCVQLFLIAHVDEKSAWNHDCDNTCAIGHSEYVDRFSAAC